MNLRLVVLIALAGAAWLAVSQWPDKAARETVEPAAWPAASDLRAQLAGIALENRHGSYNLVPELRGAGGWKVMAPELPEAPTEALADTEKVEALVTFLGANAPLRDLGAPVGDDGLAAYGLDQPAASLNLKGDTPLTVSLGERNPVGDGVYALASVRPGQVLLLDSAWLDELGRAPTHFYDLDLCPLTLEDVARLTYQGASSLEGDGTEAWELIRDQARYHFAAPAEATGHAVSDGEIDFYLHGLVTARAEALGAPGAVHGGDRAVERLLRLEAWRENAKAPYVLEVFATDEGRTLYRARASHRPGEEFLLDKDRVRRLIATAFSLRDRRVAPFDTGKTARLRLVDGHETVLEKREGRWRHQHPHGPELQGVDVLLWRLSELAFLSDPATTTPLGADKVLEIHVTDKEGGHLARLTLFTDPELPDGQLWLMPEGGDYHPVDGGILEDLRALARVPEPTKE